MRTKRIVSILVALTLLNTVSVLLLLGLRLWDHRERTNTTYSSDLAALYATMNTTELSTRFAQPDLFDGRDDFARPNALNEILKRGLVKRGMGVEAIRRVLGHPDRAVNSEGLEGHTLGKPFDWYYDNLPASGLMVCFTADERVSRIRWIFDDAPDGVSRSRDF